MKKPRKEIFEDFLLFVWKLKTHPYICLILNLNEKHIK